MVLLFLLAAHAATPLSWERGDFGQDAAIAGTDGWVNGYAADTWYGLNGVAASLTDHNTTNDPTAVRNWLIRGPDVQQMEVDALLFNEDDDTIGLVFAHDGDDTYYLAAHTANNAPPPITILDPANDPPIVYLLRVVDGVPTELGRAEVTLSATEYTKLSVRVDDGHVVVLVNDVQQIDVADTLLAAGQVGFYAYDAGYDGTVSTDAWFDSITVRNIDEDDDGVVDDLDNCEEDANPDQANADGDLQGDACDPDFEDTGDTGDDTADTDTDTGGDTVDSADSEDPYADEDLSGARCGCSQVGPVGALPLFALALPWFRRRRWHSRPVVG